MVVHVRLRSSSQPGLPFEVFELAAVLGLVAAASGRARPAAACRCLPLPSFEALAAVRWMREPSWRLRPRDGHHTQPSCSWQQWRRPRPYLRATRHRCFSPRGCGTLVLGAGARPPRRSPGPRVDVPSSAIARREALPWHIVELPRSLSLSRLIHPPDRSLGLRRRFSCTRALARSSARASFRGVLLWCVWDATEGGGLTRYLGVLLVPSFSGPGQDARASSCSVQRRPGCAGPTAPTVRNRSSSSDRSTTTAIDSGCASNIQGSASASENTPADRGPSCHQTRTLFGQGNPRASMNPRDEIPCGAGTPPAPFGLVIN